MSIHWMRTADVYPDGGYGPNEFIVFDPEARFPRFHMETDDETIGSDPLDREWTGFRSLALVNGCFSSWLSLCEPKGGEGSEPRDAGRRMIGAYRHYRSTRPEQYPRRPSEVQRNDEG